MTGIREKKSSQNSIDSCAPCSLSPVNEERPGAAGPRSLMLWGLLVYSCFSTVLFIYCFEGLWRTHSVTIYAALGLLCLFSCGLSMVLGRLYRFWDVWLLILFTTISWISSIVSFGFTHKFFFSIYFTNWVFIISLYFLVRSWHDPSMLMKCWARVSAIGYSALCLRILVNATATLCIDGFKRDTFLGCFQMGRLCGLANANTLGFCCIAMLIAAVFGFMNESGKIRILYAFSSVIGWFTLGLTNCRTGIMCIAISLGILTFYYMRDRSLRSAGFTLPAFLKAAALSTAVIFISMEAFYLPTTIYRQGLIVGARISGNSFLADNISTPVSRAINAGAGTLEDRFLIHKKVIGDIFSTPRRTWIGVSELNEDRVSGVYGGHHEILSAHAHSTFLEIMRREGLIGFMVWAALVYTWCSNGLSVLAARGTPAAARYLMGAAASILIISFTEAALCPYRVFSYISIAFFLICAFAMRMGDKKQ